MIVLSLFACADGTPTAAPDPVPSRFEAVAPDPKDVEAPSTFCDTWAEAGAAKPFPAPPLAEGTWPAAATTWRWVNVWATWCGPCVAEMPTLVKWQDKLSKEGTKVDLLFVSVDADEKDVERFRAKHPDTPPSVRLKDAASLAPWLTALGLDQNTAIPIHAFVDPENRLRCLRMGALQDHHLPTIRQLFR